MTLFDQLKRQIKDLDDLARLQRSARLALRALWLGMAGILLAWAVHTLWGVLPDPLAWFAIGMAVTLVPFTMVLIILYPLVTDLLPSRDWIDALDSRLRLREQFSTAWEIVLGSAQQKAGKPAADPQLNHLLVAEMVAVIPQARTEVLKSGWYRKLDLAALGLLSLMLIGVLAALLLQPFNQPAAANPPPPIPQTGQQLDPQQSQPSNGDGSQSGGQGAQNGQPQDNNGSSPDGSGNNSSSGGNPSGNSPGGTQGGSQNGGSASGMDAGAVANALRQLGDQLSQQAGTYDLGQALKNLDMNGAANNLQQLGNQLDQLSPESRQNLSNALGNTAQNLNQTQTDPQAQQLSQDMQNAAGVASDPNAPPGAAQQALGQLSQDLQQLDGAISALKNGGSSQNGAASNGPGIGQGQDGNGNRGAPVERLPGGNGQMDLPQQNADNSGLLNPAVPDAAGNGAASGSLDANRSQPDSAGSPLLPNSLLWKWRDVVSQYFQHNNSR